MPPRNRLLQPKPGDGVLTLPAFPERMLHGDARGYLASCETVLGILSPDVRVEVDAARLADFDSTAIAVLLSLRRAVVDQRGAMHVHNLPTRLRDLATVYGVSELLPA